MQTHKAENYGTREGKVTTSARECFTAAMVGACNFVPVPVIQRPAPAHGATGPVFVMSEGHGSIRQALDLKWDHRSHQIFRFYPPVLLADHSNKLSVPTQRQDLRCPPFERGRVMRLLVSCIASPGTLRSQLNSTNAQQRDRRCVPIRKFVSARSDENTTTYKDKPPPHWKTRAYHRDRFRGMGIMRGAHEGALSRHLFNMQRNMPFRKKPQNSVAKEPKFPPPSRRRLRRPRNSERAREGFTARRLSAR